jgi:hypothetical protein
VEGTAWPSLLELLLQRPGRVECRSLADRSPCPEPVV